MLDQLRKGGHLSSSGNKAKLEAAKAAEAAPPADEI
jgi:hypothetical protein